MVAIADGSAACVSEETSRGMAGFRRASARPERDSWMAMPGFRVKASLYEQTSSYELTGAANPDNDPGVRPRSPTAIPPMGAWDLAKHCHRKLLCYDNCAFNCRPRLIWLPNDRAGSP